MKFIAAFLLVVLYSEVGLHSVFAGPRSDIMSGDTIALRSANTSSTKWLACSQLSCGWTNCPGAAKNSKGLSPCSKEMVFVISGKKEGRISSGYTVSLSSAQNGTLLRCTNSKTDPCSLIKENRGPLRGDMWLEYSYATFQIFSRDAEDASPVDDGDVVGFKYPFSSNGAWLTYFGGQFYPRFCSKQSKKPCADENKPAGFVIFKVKS